jgi:hypothetical protein
MASSDFLGALQSYQQAMTSGRGAYDQALAQQMAAAQQPVDRQGALLRMAQGFLSPTKTGAFAENLGMAVGNYADANDKNREQEMDRAMKLAQIQAARAKLQMEGAGQDFDIFSRGHEYGEKQRNSALGDLIYGGGASLPGVAADASAAAGMPMPSLPGASAPLVDMDLFSPNETAPKYRMQRFQPQPVTEDGEPLPTRRPTPPESAAPVAVPGLRTDMLPSNGMEEFAQSPAPMPGQFGPMGFDENMPIPRDGVQTLRTRNANDQIDARLSPQPQQPAPQQVPQQQSRGGGAEEVFSAAEQQHERLQSLAAQHPQLRKHPQFREEMKRVEDVLLKADTPLIREYRHFQNETPNWREIAPSLAHFKRMGAANLTVGGQQDQIWGNAESGNVWLRDEGGKVITEPDPSGRGVRPVQVPIAGSAGDQKQRDADRERLSRSRTTATTATTLLDEVTGTFGLKQALGFDPETGKYGESQIAAPWIRKSIADNPTGYVAKFYAGTPTGDFISTLASIQDTIGIERLLQIKEAGSGLGAVPAEQLRQLARALGSLDAGLSDSLLRNNIQRVQTLYENIVRESLKDDSDATFRGVMADMSPYVGEILGIEREPAPSNPVDSILEKYGVR